MLPYLRLSLFLPFIGLPTRSSLYSILLSLTVLPSLSPSVVCRGSAEDHDFLPFFYRNSRENRRRHHSSSLPTFSFFPFRVCSDISWLEGQQLVFPFFPLLILADTSNSPFHSLYSDPLLLPEVGKAGGGGLFPSPTGVNVRPVSFFYVPFFFSPHHRRLLFFPFLFSTRAY